MLVTKWRWNQFPWSWKVELPIGGNRSKLPIKMGKSKVKTWEKMRSLMMAAFLPLDSAISFPSFAAYSAGRQDSRRVCWGISWTSSPKNLADSEEQLVSCFIEGLRSTIADQMGIQPAFTVANACRQGSLMQKRKKGKFDHFHASFRSGGVWGSSKPMGKSGKTNDATPASTKRWNPGLRS